MTVIVTICLYKRKIWIRFSRRGTRQCLFKLDWSMPVYRQIFFTCTEKSGIIILFAFLYFRICIYAAMLFIDRDSPAYVSCETHNKRNPFARSLTGTASDERSDKNLRMLSRIHQHVCVGEYRYIYITEKESWKVHRGLCVHIHQEWTPAVAQSVTPHSPQRPLGQKEVFFLLLLPLPFFSFFGWCVIVVVVVMKRTFVSYTDEHRSSTAAV